MCKILYELFNCMYPNCLRKERKLIQMLLRFNGTSWTSNGNQNCFVILMHLYSLCPFFKLDFKHSVYFLMFLTSYILTPFCIYNRENLTKIIVLTRRQNYEFQIVLNRAHENCYCP